jgi:hypothetical protein
VQKAISGGSLLLMQKTKAGYKVRSGDNITFDRIEK